jgi:hypothetical protein
VYQKLHTMGMIIKGLEVVRVEEASRLNPICWNPSFHIFDISLGLSPHNDPRDY